LMSDQIITLECK